MFNTHKNRRDLLFVVALVLLPAGPACRRGSLSAEENKSLKDQTPELSAVADDIRLIVEGNFTPTALGVPVYDAVLARVRVRPKEYLREFEVLYLGTGLDARQLSHLYLPSFLKRLSATEPAMVKSIAGSLLQRYDGILFLCDQASNKNAFLAMFSEELVRTIQRLEDRRSDLRLLVGGAASPLPISR